MLIRLNERFKKLFKDYLDSLKTTSSYSGCNYNGYSYGGYNHQSNGGSVVYNHKPSSNTIYFYEWSTLENKSKVFYSLKSFKDFCTESNVNMLPQHEDIITSKYYVYCTCIPGSNVLMVRTTYNELKEALEKHKSSFVN
ncbi:MAG: hypothetical protein IKT40_12380 [Bacilli bacterium]|nr:hypothetical protein [Bacilli bacterium]